MDILANPDVGYKVTVSFPTDDGPGSSVEDLTYFSAQIGEDHVTVEVTFTKIPVTLTVQQGESEISVEKRADRNTWYVHARVTVTYAIGEQSGSLASATVSDRG